VNIIASLAIQSWSKWTEGEIDGKKFMGMIIKLEKTLLKEGYIKEPLSDFFKEVLNYKE
jgi:hypothetical protein